MAAPKHKIFFGALGVKPKKSLTAKPGQVPGNGPVITIPCWTWDTEFPIFSSQAKTFDCDYSVEELELSIINTSGFTWDNETVTMDTESKIYN